MTRKKSKGASPAPQPNRTSTLGPSSSLCLRPHFLHLHLLVDSAGRVLLRWLAVCISLQVSSICPRCCQPFAESSHFFPHFHRVLSTTRLHLSTSTRALRRPRSSDLGTGCTAALELLGRPSLAQLDPQRRARSSLVSNLAGSQAVLWRQRVHRPQESHHRHAARPDCLAERSKDRRGRGEKLASVARSTDVRDRGCHVSYVYRKLGRPSLMSRLHRSTAEQASAPRLSASVEPVIDQEATEASREDVLEGSEPVSAKKYARKPLPLTSRANSLAFLQRVSRRAFQPNGRLFS